MAQYAIEITDEHVRAAKILGLKADDIEFEIDKRVNRYFIALVRAAKSELVKNKTISQIEAK